jgi:hypothetical protein
MRWPVKSKARSAANKPRTTRGFLVYSIVLQAHFAMRFFGFRTNNSPDIVVLSIHLNDINMEATLHTPLVKIEKEYVGQLHFPKTDVLTNPAMQAIRANKLNQAAKLGNLEKHKVQIDFQDSTGVKRVETTIWSITERYVILKSNMRIPINRILDIKLL